MQVNVEKKRDSTKQKQENREAFNRHVAPDMREREKKKRTKDFLARQTENQKKETKVKKIKSLDIVHIQINLSRRRIHSTSTTIRRIQIQPSIERLLTHLRTFSNSLFGD